MKIINIRAMRGPNYWSVQRPQLIVMKIDLEALEHSPTNQIEGFYERLTQLVPSLIEHRCSENRKGGFFYRVMEGTWMGHVIEHLALEMQTLAGMDCGFGQTRSAAEPGVYHVVFDYVVEKAGLYVAKAALTLVEAMIAGADSDRLAEELETHLQLLRKIHKEESLGPSTASIVTEAEKRGIPWKRLDDESLISLGYGSSQQRIRATLSGSTSYLAVELAGNKESTKSLLQAAAVPVPKGETVRDEAELREAVVKIGYPLVIKPIDGNHGRGASINVATWETAIEGLKRAKQVSDDVLVEQFVTGYDFRLLVINYQFVAAALRTPAAVTGDGKLTIQQLIDAVNSDPNRGQCHERVLTAIQVDEATLDLLRNKNLTLNSIPASGETVYLKQTANLSTGGTATDVTEMVHPANIRLAERIARCIGLDICGIDVMAPNLTQALIQNGGVVLEVNAAPGFRMHLAPTIGRPRNVGAPVVDMLFPPGTSPLIPIVAVTGTNGKTTTTRLIAHLVKTKGYNVGFTTTEGVYIGEDMVEVGDCTGPGSADLVLQDPSVDFAVLECARGGILRSGLGFRRCDVGVVTNVTEDHMGLNDIHTLEQMARVKATVPKTVTKEGYAVLNADDDAVYAMAANLDCQVALFSMNANHPRIIQHCEAGRLAAFPEEGFITLCRGTHRVRICHVTAIPLTYDGTAGFMIQNTLAAVLAAFVQDIDLETIRVGLRTFLPSPESTPGRMNIFQFRHFRVLVDYAHNPAGFEAIGQYLSSLPDAPKLGLICGTGDRRDQDLLQLGKLAGEMFDEIVIRHDKDSRGRASREIVSLLSQGIREVCPERPIKIIPDEAQAIHYAIQRATPQSLVMICCDDVLETLRMVQMHQKDDQEMTGGEAFLQDLSLSRMRY